MSEQQRGKANYVLGGIGYDGTIWVFNPHKQDEDGDQCLYVRDNNGNQYDDFNLTEGVNILLHPDIPIIVDLEKRLIVRIDEARR